MWKKKRNEVPQRHQTDSIDDAQAQKTDVGDDRLINFADSEMYENKRIILPATSKLMLQT